MPKHLSSGELQAGLPVIRQAPGDNGLVRAIVIRPETNQRQSLQTCEFSPGLGVHGDNWAKGCWLTLDDGSPHPDVQVAIMNARVIELVAQDPDRWPLAGDNLFIDLDLSEDNLPFGQQLSVGSTVLEVTDTPHNGCAKFAERFGPDSVKFVNSPEGKQLHLRGIYAKIVQAGTVQVGDTVKKI